MSGRNPVIVDHDGGVDDLAAALVIAGGNHYRAATPDAPAAPPLEIIGSIVVDADCFAAEAAECTQKALSMVMRLHPPPATPVPVAISTCKCKSEPFPDDWRKDCINMLDLPCLNTPSTAAAAASGRYAALVTEPGEAVMARLVMDSPEPVTLVVTGPLSNVGWCIETHGEAFCRNVRAVVIMGGAVDVKGNIFPPFVKGRDDTAEWNLFWDAPAARTVLETPLLRAEQRVLFGLDATNHVPVTPAFVRRFGRVTRVGSDAAAEAVSDVAQFLGGSWAMCTHFEKLYGDGKGYYAWDALTAAYVVDPRVSRTEVCRVKVDAVSGSPSEGRTQRCGADEGGEITLAVWTDAELFYAMTLCCAAVA